MNRPARLTLTLLALAGVIGAVAIVKFIFFPAAPQRTITVGTQPSAGKSYPHVASASLGRLDLMRQATLEADVPDDFRRRMLGVIDDTHRQLTAALDDESLGPTTREAQIAAVQEAFARAANDDRINSRAMSDRLDFIWFELDLLSRRRLLPLMFQHLDMTPEQHKQADAAFMEVSVVLRNEPAGGAPNERSMQAMLSGRDKLHALLTPPQRDQFMQVLRDERKARQQPRLAPSTRPSTQAR